MENGFNEPFEVAVNEDSNNDRPHFDIYHGMILSELFNGDEKMLLMQLIASADNSNPNQINTTTISVNKLSRETGKGKTAVYKYIQSLEEKGVLIKENPVPEDNGSITDTYKILNFESVWDCRTLDELKKETDRIKSELKK